MCVRNQFGPSAEITKQARENGTVCRTWNWRPDTLAREPFFHMTPSRRNRWRPHEDLRVRNNTHKGEQAFPRQPHAAVPAQLTIQPTTRPFVTLRPRISGVDQNVGVNQDHARVLPEFSTSSKTSQTLSRLPTRHAPISSGFVRKGFRGLGLVSSFKPRRKAELTACLKLSFCFARHASSCAATSSSRLSVVLMHQIITLLMS